MAPRPLEDLDELPHFISSEDGNAAAGLVYSAVRPSTIQFGREGCFIALSTPLWPHGKFFELCRDVETGT